MRKPISHDTLGLCLQANSSQTPSSFAACFNDVLLLKCPWKLTVRQCIFICIKLIFLKKWKLKFNTQYSVACHFFPITVCCTVWRNFLIHLAPYSDAAPSCCFCKSKLCLCFQYNYKIIKLNSTWKSSRQKLVSSWLSRTLRTEHLLQ